MKKSDIKHLGLTVSPYEDHIRQAQYAIDVMDKDYTLALGMKREDMRNAWNFENASEEEKKCFEVVMDGIFNEDGSMNPEKMAEVMRTYYSTATDYSTIITMRGRNMHESIHRTVQYMKLLSFIGKQERN